MHPATAGEGRAIGIHSHTRRARTGLGRIASKTEAIVVAHAFIGVEADFAIGLAPDEADRQATPKLPAMPPCADATVEPGAQDVEFRPRSSCPSIRAGAGH